MSRDEEQRNARLFDRRVVDRNIKKGLVTSKDYEKYLKALPDAAAKLAPKDEPLPDDDDMDDIDDDADETDGVASDGA
jgi:hypothetical protein